MRQVTGDYPGAGVALECALEISRAAGDRSGEANALNDLGEMQYLSGENALARKPSPRPWRFSASSATAMARPPRSAASATSATC